MMNIARGVFSATIAVLLAGCGGSQPPIGAPGAPLWDRTGGRQLIHERVFKFTGSEQFFKVPAGVKELRVVARGAGGLKLNKFFYFGGRGGRVVAEIPVTPGERLAVFVGGTTKHTTGGYNGGGAGNYSGDLESYGGGGASDVREGGDSLGNRIIVAGGGGGHGENGGDGGSGGGLKARSGGPGHLISYKNSGGRRGHGGDQTRGGRGGRGLEPGANGSSGTGGAGGESQHNGAGGGGGGGYYGGGGGGGLNPNTSSGGGGGGGGGSSYVEPKARVLQNAIGWRTARGNGVVVFRWQ